MPNISRKHMPQVNTQNLGKALDMVSDKVKVTKGKIEAGKLKKSQKELYKDKIEGIAKRFTSPDKFKPLIISKDNHIVDGHHRWGAAIYKWGEDVKIPVYRINLSVNNAIKLYKHIADVIDEVIKEVGEGSAKPFKFIKTQNTPNEKQYMFLTKSELPYYVSFDYFDRWGLWSIEFATVGGDDDEVVNQGEMYNVMATIANVTKDFIKRVNPKGLLYNPAKNFDGDTRREKLYLAYFKKLLPKWKLTKQSVYTVFNNPAIKEDITIPIKVGDTVLGGKFKNKRIVVKDIGKNEKGDITINGKPLLKYRLVSEANAVSGGKVHKFITGKNLTLKGKKYSDIEFEVLGTDNNAQLVKLRVLSPKEVFGMELNVPFKTIRRGPFLKTDTSNQFEGTINEIPMADLQKIDTFADKQLNPVDVVLTDKHFFDRLNDPRNGKEISQAELIGFFKRLSKKRKEFVEFLNTYNSLVAVDDRTNINIPFMKQANKAIAKTIMRKKDFKTPDKKLDI